MKIIPNPRIVECFRHEPDEESDPIRFDHRLASEEDAKTRWSEKWEEEMERVESREDDINKSKGQRRREDGKRFRM